MIPIKTSKNDPWLASKTAVESLFPEISIHIRLYGLVNVPILAGELSLPKQLSSSTINSALRALFGTVKHANNPFHNIRPQILSGFESIINTDVQNFQHHNGLVKSRNHFVVLAFFAGSMNSTMLANALLKCFWDQRHTIMGQERTKYLPEWAAAIQALSDVAPSDEIVKCLQYLARRRNDITTEYYNSGIQNPLIDAILSILDSAVSGEFDRGRRIKRRMPTTPRARTVHYLPSPPTPPLYLPQPKEDQLVLSTRTPPPDLTLHNSYINAQLEYVLWRQDMLEKKLEKLEMD